jgi:transposase-like protein
MSETETDEDKSEDRNIEHMACRAGKQGSRPCKSKRAYKNVIDERRTRYQCVSCGERWIVETPTSINA